jgi:hypothetical protein
MSKFDKETEAFARACPKTWAIISGRRYLIPNYRQADYANQVQLINEYVQHLADFCSGVLEHKEQKDNIATLDAHLANLALALEHNRPTYFLERELGEALLRTVLPEPFDPESIKWKFPQMRIMLPKNLLRADYENGRIQSLTYLDIARFDQNKRVSFPKELVRELELDPRISANRLNANKGPLEKESFRYTASAGIAITNRITHPDFPLESMNRAILEAWPLIDIPKLNRSICLDEVITSVNWSVMDARIKHLALNILLFLSSSPEDFKFLPEVVRPPGHKGKRFVSGLYQARFIGDSQRIKVKKEPQIIASKTLAGSAHAAHWVAGHWHTFLIGKGRLEPRLQWVQPYKTGNKEESK